MELLLLITLMVPIVWTNSAFRQAPRTPPIHIVVDKDLSCCSTRNRLKLLVDKENGAEYR